MVVAVSVDVMQIRPLNDKSPYKARVAPPRATSEDFYVLPRDAGESERLQAQHDHLRRSLGGLLVHPSLRLQHRRTILDCCTGTGAWLKDARLAAHPDAILEACDITLEQYHRGDAKADDVFVQNILHPFPQEKRNRYDMIHQRYLTGGISRHQWSNAIRNVVEALKPGGYLNITEPNLETSPPSLLDDASGISNWKWQLKQLSWQKNNLIEQCADEIPALLRDAGLINVQTIRMRVPYGASCRALGMSENQVESTIRLHMSPSFDQALKKLWISSSKGTAEEFDRNQAMYESFLREKGIWMDVSFVIGMKPY
ncbi:hypothetical protein GLOTRDRAFT_129845 [Gloeophyllum trabeum ATCC 11539]|uniref:S-adenosyl-L-methionine-dependent methyltransferase n=1 Tax=Gloeophyllum trabeum (strain ATCC 11539 / FP-39264 / Madison 617) TaxID=670483 RepID=S7Q4Q8_GLOTA|nr:uncharacterized protein GLOTRDRAFT_129845 [Gloeophyllum trabeum ATCC 11539]EPQ54482.1 hypothetical protein GLOTRDRAFT_129845 [Gloeophyllum trabeum ATCC 11539]